ncbi:MAG: hypothetical protein ABSE90_06345 [Verrucomicrobiota bacterium]|jgi:hypothetical protein
MSDTGSKHRGQGLILRHRNFFTGLLLAVAAWIFYLPSTQYGFVHYDDIRILQNHPELYGRPHLSADLKAIFLTSFPREEPLLARDATWALDSRIFGFGNPFGYHLGNVLLHGIVVALLFVFLLGTTRRYGFALATTVAYLVLAAHTEPVAWIMGRKDILSALFMLLALCAQTQRLTAEGMAARWAWYAAALAFFAVGLLSKISVLTFPLMLFLHAIFFPYLCCERSPDAPFLWGRALAREGLLLAPSLAMSGVIYVWYQRILAQMGIFDRGYTAHGLAHLWNLLMIDPLAFWLYLRQIFSPWRLTVLYTWPALQSSYPSWQIATALATMAAIIVIGVWLFRRHKDVFFYYAVFFVLMVPYMNLIYIGILVAERYIYFPAFCVLAVAVSLAGAALRRPKPAWRIGVLTISVVFAAINVFQKLSYEQVWRNGETLWQYHVALPRPSPTTYENLAAYYYADFTSAVARQNTPRVVSSIRKMEIVIQAGLEKFWRDRQQPPPPETSHLFFLQSLVQEVKGDPDAALASLLTSDRLHPKFDSTNLNLARLYRKLSKTATDPKQRETYARAAQARFAEYIALAFRGRPASPEVQKEFEEIKADVK